MLELQLAVFARHPEIGLTCGRCAARITPAVCTDADFDRVLAVTETRAFLVATKMWTSTILVRRNVVGTNRFVSGLEPAEDRDLWVRLVSAAPVYGGPSLV
jgi:hypothetical protein